ncbi:FAD-dependent oxidoreductase [Paenibacillus puerhi]|uniref:FAD-dependent oxidoreductase n=1 Tax=Paenibacillus puerhi TaxID=2692622 RepID=UPI001916AB07|nr:FAD-dependent oxidoreductase [Paenibacillus puerhi]
MKLFHRGNGIPNIFAILIIILLLLVFWFAFKDSFSSSIPSGGLLKVENSVKIKSDYDVIVVGTDPEGVAAAVSAARNNLSVLLVDGRNRAILGGLMTLGWLNSLDLNYSPEKTLLPGKHNFLNKGIFQEWYDKVEGTSFDVVTAANVFYELVEKEKNIDLLLGASEIKPQMEQSQVTGLLLKKKDGTALTVNAKAVIDATQDADIAADAGVPFTFGREDIGDPKTLMAVTLVFKIGNVTQTVWDSFSRHPNTGADSRSAWGFWEMWDYPSTNKERVRMRGLNIGRQIDDTILINALQIMGVDPLDPIQMQEAYEIGKNEIPKVVDYMKQNFKEFSQVELVDIAPELYVRESRHMVGEYRLKMTDVLENRDFWDRIAFGSYNVDIQSTSYSDRGAIMMNPIQYAIPFRSIVPQQIDGILVVGRSASFDSLPHGSARVIPVGMATGQAAGAAVKLSIDKKITFRQISKSTDEIQRLQEMLNEQGMVIKPYKIDQPDYTRHRAYRGLKAAVSLYLSVGGEQNKFDLDDNSNVKRFSNNLKRIVKIYSAHFQGDPDIIIENMENPEKVPLTLEFVKTMISSILVTESDISAHIDKETIAEIKDPNKLTNGDAYMIIADLIRSVTGVVFE